MRAWMLVAAAAVGLAGCGQGGGNVATGPGAPVNFDQAASAAQDAATKLATMAQGSATGATQLPRATDATAGPLLNAVFNTAAVPSTTLTSTQLGEANSWLSSANNVGLLYMLAGTGQTSISTVTPAMNEKVGENLLAYAPELGRYFDTELALLAAESGAVSQQLVDDPGRLNNPTSAAGLAQMRGGVAQTLAGVITTITSPGPTDDWREARGKALVAAAPNSAKLLAPEVRAQLQAQATTAAASATDTTLKTELTQFASLIAPAGS